MSKNEISSFTSQVAEILRRGITHGRWRDALPGRLPLAEELGCSHWTIDAAIQVLTKEGLLVSQGRGRPRQIELSGRAMKASRMRIQILRYERDDNKIDYLVELSHLLQEAGHDVSFATKALHDLGMDTERVGRFVQTVEADAWVVIAGSQDVLRWFETEGIPAFALFGRIMNISLASTSPKKADAYTEVVERLVGLGHRRIIFITRGDRRKPSPGFLELHFLDLLKKHGIPTGDYNLPDWEESPQGLQQLLNKLFQHTPPTALLVDGPELFSATRDHLSRRGILAPEHISLICTDPEPSSKWCLPQVTHITWNSEPMIRRIVKWARNISIGKDDRRKSSHKAQLVLGGTIGVAPKS